MAAKTIPAEGGHLTSNHNWGATLTVTMDTGNNTRFSTANNGSGKVISSSNTTEGSFTSSNHVFYFSGDYQSTYSISFDKASDDPDAGYGYGSVSGSITAVSPDTAITSTPSASADTGTVTIGSGGSSTTYQVWTRAASSDGSFAANSVGRSRTGNGSINLDTVLGNQGEVHYYKIKAKVNAANGGVNTYVETTGDQFDFTRAITSVPTSVSVSDDDAFNANVTVTLTAAGTVPTGCSRQYSKDGTNWQTSNTFLVARSQTKTYYCRYVNGSVAGPSKASAAYSPGYISPDLGVTVAVEQNGSAATFNLISGVSNVTVELSGLRIYDDFRVVVDAASTNGSVAAGYGTVATTLENGSRNSASLAVAAAALPDVYAELAYFRVESRRPTDRGGSGVWTNTNDDFDIGQAMLPLTGSLVISYGSEVSPTVTATIAAKTPATGLTVEYTATGTGFWTTSRGFAVTRGANNTFQARQVNYATNIASSAISVAEVAPLVGPDTDITVTSKQSGVTKTTISGTSGVTTDLNSLGAYTDYRVRTYQTSSNNSGTARTVNTSTGDGFRQSASLAHAYSATASLNEVPFYDGEEAYYRVEARQSTANGGDNSWYNCNEDFVLTQEVSTASNPVVSYASTAAADAVATLTAITAPTFCTTYYRRGSGSWTTTRTYTGTRGTSYTYQTKFINTTTTAEGSNGQTVDIFPYISPVLSGDWDLYDNNVLADFGLVLTSNIEYRYTGLGANDDYRIKANAASTNGSIADNFVASTVNTNGSTSRTFVLNPVGGVPTVIGEIAYYTLEARRSTAKGGNNNWVLAEDHVDWAFIEDAPTGGSVSYFGENATTIGAIVSLLTNKANVAEQYNMNGGAWTTDRNFQSPYNTTYTFQRRYYNTISGLGTPAESIINTSPFKQPDLNIQYDLEQNGSSFTHLVGTTSVDAVVTQRGEDTSIRLRADGISTDGSVTVADKVIDSDETAGVTTANMNFATTGEVPGVEGEQCAYKWEVRVSEANGGNNSWTAAAAAPFTLTQQVRTGYPPNVQYATTASPTADSTQDGQPTGGDLISEYRRGSASWSTNRVVSGTRGTTYTYQTRYRNPNTNVVGDSGQLVEMFPWKNPLTNITINDPQNGASIPNSYVGDLTLTVSGGNSITEYRAISTNSPNASSVGTGGIGSVVGNGNINIGYANNELPVSGESITYQMQARVPEANGGDDTYANISETFTLERSGYCSFRMGGTTVTSSGGAAGPITITGPGYYNTFDVDATVDATYGGGVNTITVNEDHDENGSWANAGWSGTTDTPSNTGTFYGGFYFLNNGLDGNSSNTYRFKGYLISGDGATGGSPQIDYQFAPDNTGVTPSSQDTQTQAFAVTVSGTHTYYEYLISDVGVGDAGGGVWMAGGAQPAGVKSQVKTGTGGNLSFGPSDGTLTSGVTKEYFVWIKRNTNTDNTWYVTDANFFVTKTYTITMGTTTISHSSDVGGGTVVTISGSATIPTGSIDSLDIFDVEGNAPGLSAKINTGIGTGSATVTRTFTSANTNKTYSFKTTALDDLGGTEDSNSVYFISTKTGSTETPNPGSGLYGLEIRNASNQVVMDSTSRVARYVTGGQGSSSSTGPNTHSFTGLAPGAGFEVILINGTGGGADQFVRLDWSIQTNQLTVHCDFSDTTAPLVNYYYWIFKS